jgi:hypothetical protein
MRTGGLGMGMWSIGLREVRGFEPPEASTPDFTGVTVPRDFLSDVRGKGAELAACGRGG